MMMCPRGKGKKPDISSEELKGQIIKVARRHFATSGFQGASLKEIARDANVAGSLLNYHFGDKHGLFLACLETFARDRMVAVQRILGEVHTREELRVRLKLFVEEMLESIVADPHGFEIIDREVRAGNDPHVLKIFQETMLVAFTSVVEFFKTAQERGLLRDDIDPLICASTLFTTTCDSARKEAIAKRFFNISWTDPEFRAHFARQIVEFFMHGVVK